MAPIAPQTNFNSGPDCGLISHSRLVTTSKAKVNTLSRGGATFGLVTEGSLYAGGHAPFPTEPVQPGTDEGPI